MESQLERRIPGREVRTYRMPHRANFTPTKTVARPAAYLVPQDLSRVIEKLQHHRIRLDRLTASRTFNGEIDRVRNVSKAPSPDVGSMTREETVISASREPGRITGRAGDVLVPTDQILGTLAVYLLEPESDDGLVRWGYLDDRIRAGEILPISRIAGF
ncbi:MAG: hypothetical protein EHM91_04570 [Planctomycetota bacterium]|nr:MAG: hypothetical protein EHM91_04570 [Planctomycetota bacterium]